MTDSYDCVVVGCDLAAIAAATLIVQSGLKTLLLSSEEEWPEHGDLILPCSERILDRLGVLERMAPVRSTVGQSLQLLRADGERLLTLGDGTNAGARFWRLSSQSLRRVLMEAARCSGVRCESSEARVEVGMRQGLWRVIANLAGEVQWNCSASIFIDTRHGPESVTNGAHVWAYYRGVQPLDPICAAAAIRPLDANGWCSLVPIADGLTAVRAVFRERLPENDRHSPAEVLEDRLVQCPGLLERMLSAELIGDLYLARAGRLVDPWSAFAASNDLLIGEYLAGAALDAFQSGEVGSIPAPLRPLCNGGFSPPVAASLERLLGPEIDEPGFAEQRVDLVRTLNVAIHDCQPANSPFPPTGDKAILTRV